MVTVILKQEVVNFIEWKKIFDQNESLRKQNQIETIGVYSSVENPDVVTCIVQAPSIEAFNNHYFNNPMVAENLKNSGELMDPIIEFYNTITDL
jgi:hypothetical protein